MKYFIKLTFGVLLTLTSLISCNKNDEETELNDKFIDASKYGQYHNELLKSYFDNKGKANDYITLYNELGQHFNNLHKNILTKRETEFYKSRLLEVGGENLEITPENYRSITTKGIKLFYSEKTEKVLLDLFYNSSRPEEVLKEFNELLNDKTINEIEKNEIEKMLSVYKASMKFWSNGIYAKNTNKGCDPNHQVFFADAVGCMFGGLGSVGYSWAIYTLQNKSTSQDDRHCI